MAGAIEVLRIDGSVLRVGGIPSLAELVADGLVGLDDRLGGTVPLGEIDELGWAFAVAPRHPEAYGYYRVIGADPDWGEEREPYLAYEVSSGDPDDSDDDIPDDDEDERAAEQPETD